MEESKKVKNWCEIEYESYKKKYESSINNYSIYYEKMRVRVNVIY